MQKKFRLMMGVAALAASAFALSGTAEAAPHGVKVGSLVCHVSSGWGFILGSSKDLRCAFHPAGKKLTEHYEGTVNKFGVDIGYTDGGVIVWEVIAPSSDIRPGSVQGDYAGATASATVGAGLGANVLVGGLDKSIALQPLSIEGNTGLNVAAGIGAINLKFEP